MDRRGARRHAARSHSRWAVWPPGSPARRRTAAAVANRSAGSFSSALSTAASTCGGMVCRWGSERPRALGHHPRHDRLGGRAGEGRVAGEHLVEHRAERVDVGAGRDLALAHRLLGAHVVRRAERHAGLGHPGAAGLARGERDPEVGHQRAAVVEQDVLGLDVAVDHAVPVGVVQRARPPRWRSGRLRDGELLLAVEPVAERFALDERHDVVEEAVGLARVEQRQDVRVLEVGRGLDLGQEALGADHGGQLGPQHLDRDLAVVPQILGQVDRGHPAGPDLVLEPVMTGQRTRDPRRRAAHGRSSRHGS